VSLASSGSPCALIIEKRSEVLKQWVITVREIVVHKCAIGCIA
jgi:hypothetical protein